MLIDVSRIPDAEAQLPSLDTFAAVRGLQDFSQAEQLEAFEAEYGAAGKLRDRRARLVARQLDALRWLEALVAQPPRAGDAVAAWLSPTLAAHLEAADIFTIAQLVERINGVGRRWAGSIKAIGAAKAQRIRRQRTLVERAAPHAAGLLARQARRALAGRPAPARTHRVGDPAAGSGARHARASGGGMLIVGLEELPRAGERRGSDLVPQAWWVRAVGG